MRHGAERRRIRQAIPVGPVVEQDQRFVGWDPCVARFGLDKRPTPRRDDRISGPPRSSRPPRRTPTSCIEPGEIAMRRRSARRPSGDRPPPFAAPGSSPMARPDRPRRQRMDQIMAVADRFASDTRTASAPTPTRTAGGRPRIASETGPFSTDDRYAPKNGQRRPRERLPQRATARYSPPRFAGKLRRMTSPGGRPHVQPSTIARAPRDVSPQARAAARTGRSTRPQVKGPSGFRRGEPSEASARSRSQRP